MDNTIRKLNIDNTDYNFPQGFPIIAGYSSYGSRRIDLTQSFSLPFSTQYFGFLDTFPRYASTITAEEAKTEIKKYRPLFFRWDWYDTESSGDEHIITAELYPTDGNLYIFSAEVPITVYRYGTTTTYLSRINISLLSNTFSYTYINTIYPNALNDMSDVAITTPANGEVLTYDSANQEWINSPNISLERLEIRANINDADLDYSADISSAKFINCTYHDNAKNSDITVSEFATGIGEGRMVYLGLGTISTGTTKVLYTPIIYTDLIGNNSLTRTISVINKVGNVAYAGHYEISFAGTPSINYVYEGTIDTSTAPTNLNDLNDVNLYQPSAGDMLIYDAEDNAFINQNSKYLFHSEAIIVAHLDLTNLTGSLTLKLSSVNDSYTGTDLYFIIRGNTNKSVRVIASAMRAYTDSGYTDYWDIMNLGNTLVNDPRCVRVEMDLYFMTGPSTLYKVNLTATKADPQLVVNSITTVNDIFS